MTEPGSVSRYLLLLRSHDDALREQAVRVIWQRYFPALLRLAQRKLDPRTRRREDELDVLQDACHSFFLRQQRGDFDLATRDDLWQVLVLITVRKVRNAARRQRQQCRDFHREAPDNRADLWAWEQMEAADPTPEEAAILAEQVQCRLDALPEELRRVALWKLHGCTNEEIAAPERMDCAPRTVERKLERIRRLWEQYDPDADTSGPP